MLHPKEPQKKSTYRRTFQPKEQSSALDLWTTTLPVDVLWGIYARQSTQVQVVKNIESTEMQTDDLKIWLADKGVKEHSIMLFDADLGKSGRLRIDQRSDLQRLVDLIASGKIKAVLVYRISRLFRDETGVQYNVFAQVCKENNCIFATADGMVFNFRNPMHLKMFRYLAEYAAEHNAQHSTLMHQARLHKARKGYYASGAVTRGYIVDYNEKSKTYKKYIRYEPHATVTLDIFKRFYELEGDFNALCRELEAKGAVFPFFEEWVDKRNIQDKRYKKVASGYTISTHGLKLLLCNVTYLGWWVVQQEIVSRDNHEALFDESNVYLFWYAFERMADYMPDGTENERIKRQHRFCQRHTEEVHVLLTKHKLFSPQGDVFVYPNHNGPWVYQIVGEYNLLRLSVCEIENTDVDAEVTKAFFNHLKTTYDFDDYRDWLHTKSHNQQQEVSSLQRQLVEAGKQLDALIDTEVDFQTQMNVQIKMMLADNPDLDVEATKQKLKAENVPYLVRLEQRKAKLNADIATLNKKLETANRYDAMNISSKLDSFQVEVGLLHINWDKLSLADRADFINIFINKVLFTHHAPHWMQLDIEWRNPVWGTDSLHLYRQRPASPRWTDEKRAIVREMYPNQSRAEIMKRLPNKTWKSIQTQAAHMGIQRTLYIVENLNISPNLSWQDIEFMREQDIHAQTTKYLPPSK